MNCIEKKFFINNLRGLAIFLMLWGHCIQFCCGGQFDFFENILFKVIYSFHMPLFMMISGYLFFTSAIKRNLSELVVYKAKSLLYPILMGSIVNYILTVGIMSIISGGRGLVGCLNLESLWFLWSVLSASVAVSFVSKMNNEIAQFFLVLLGFIVVALFPCRQMNVWMFPYFVFGYLFAKKEQFFSGRILHFLGALGAVGFIFMLFYFEKKHYIYISGLIVKESLTESMKIDFFRWLIGLFGSVAVVWGGLLFFYVKRKKSSNFLELLGMNSLAVYVFSVSLLSYWLPLFVNKFLNRLAWIDWNKNILIYWMITFFIAVLYSVLLLCFIKLLKKMNYYNLIFGRSF